MLGDVWRLLEMLGDVLILCMISRRTERAGEEEVKTVLSSSLTHSSKCQKNFKFEISSSLITQLRVF